MENVKIRRIGAMVLTAVWILLIAAGLLLPDGELSESERRPLEQWPGITGQTLLDGSFMEKFENYSLDQFPLRDTFRQIKALFHYYALRQADNNDVYLADGYAAKLLYPLNEKALDHNLGRLQHLYEKFLRDSGSEIYAAVIPDKSYYLAEVNGYPAMDYEALFSQVRTALPWASHVDLTDCLTIEDYYRTDIHWRQERLLPAARRLCQALGVTPPVETDYYKTVLERPFYGVYYGQAALPMRPDEMVLLQSQLLDQCTVYDHESGKTVPVYDWDKLTSKDLYDVYLSGARSLLTIENPNAATDRELIVFRDSFSSSMVPLLLADYASVTLVDIRYLSTDLLGNFVDFHGQDVLILYSANVLNIEGILR